MELYRHCRQHDNHYGMQLQYTIILWCVAMNSETYTKITSEVHLVLAPVHVLTLNTYIMGETPTLEMPIGRPWPPQR